MGFRFATCDRGRALGFLRKFYPGRKIEDTPADAGPLLDLVESDVVRIPDPEFHPDGTVVPSNNWDESRKEEVVAVFTKWAGES